jgi:hypothetical protein
MTAAFDLATWGWPQWTYASIFGFNVLFAALMEGRPRGGEHSFGISLVASAIGIGILFAGGFWA